VTGPELEPFEIGGVQQLHALRWMFGPNGPPTGALAAIAQLTTAVRIPRGTVLGREGTPFSTVYLLIEGELRASRNGKPYGTFGPRNSLGFLSTLARDRRGFSCEASADTVALSMRAEDLLEVLEDHFELMYSAARGLARDGIELRRAILPDAGFRAPIRREVAVPPSPVELTERILYLRETFGLRRSYIDELAQLARAARETRYAPGASLWRSGEPATHAAILIAGSVRAASKEGAHFEFGAGDIVGALDTIGEQPRWFDAEAAEETVALTLEAEAMVDVWEDRPALGLDFLRMMATTLIDLRENAGARPTPFESATP
jgi:CRP-like cAMP-binding protein